MSGVFCVCACVDGEIVGGQLRVDNDTGDTLIRVLR